MTRKKKSEVKEPQKVENAFTIPKVSSVLNGPRHQFPKVYKKHKQNFPQIALPGSSKYGPPKMQGEDE